MNACFLKNYNGNNKSLFHLHSGFECRNLHFMRPFGAAQFRAPSEQTGIRVYMADICSISHMVGMQAEVYCSR